MHTNEAATIFNSAQALKFVGNLGLNLAGIKKDSNGPLTFIDLQVEGNTRDAAKAWARMSEGLTNVFAKRSEKVISSDNAKPSEVYTYADGSFGARFGNVRLHAAPTAAFAAARPQPQPAQQLVSNVVGIEEQRPVATRTVATTQTALRA